MKPLKTKDWYWWDIGLLKWSALLLGMVAGAFVADTVKDNAVWFLLVAILLAIKPAIAYWKD